MQNETQSLWIAKKGLPGAILAEPVLEGPVFRGEVLGHQVDDSLVALVCHVAIHEHGKAGIHCPLALDGLHSVPLNILIDLRMSTPQISITPICIASCVLQIYMAWYLPAFQ